MGDTNGEMLRLSCSFITELTFTYALALSCETEVGYMLVAMYNNKKNNGYKLLIHVIDDNFLI